MKKILMILLAVVMCATMFTACASNANVITMGTNAAFPPFESKDNGKIVGIDVDIATEIAKTAGKQLKISDMEFDSITSAVSSGKVDMGVAGMSVTEERLKNVDFSDTYFKAAQMVVVMQDSIVTADNLDGKKIGVQSGTTGDTYVGDNYKQATVSKYSSGVDAVLALINGKIDAVVIDSYTAKALAKAHTDIKVLDKELTVEEYAIEIKKGNKALLDIVNSTIRKLKADGTLDKIAEKWIVE